MCGHPQARWGGQEERGALCPSQTVGSACGQEASSTVGGALLLLSPGLPFVSALNWPGVGPFPSCPLPRWPQDLTGWAVVLAYHQQNVPCVPLGVCSNSFPSKGGCRQDVGVKHLERQRRRPTPGVRPPSPLLALSSLHRMAQGWGDDGAPPISLTTTRCGFHPAWHPADSKVVSSDCPLVGTPPVRPVDLSFLLWKHIFQLWGSSHLGCFLLQRPPISLPMPRVLVLCALLLLRGLISSPGSWLPSLDL